MEDTRPSIIAIIRVDHRSLEKQEEDIQRLEHHDFHGLKFEIPAVKVLRHGPRNLTYYGDKPLLLNYGFMRIPRYFARNPQRLREISRLSEVIQGFMYRSPSDFEQDRLKWIARSGGDEELLNSHQMAPILVQAISEEQLQLLYAEAIRLKVYQNTEELSIGSYIVIRSYPLEGLGAQVIGKKANGRVEVRLLESGLTIRLQTSQIDYSTLQWDDEIFNSEA